MDGICISIRYRKQSVYSGLQLLYTGCTLCKSPHVQDLFQLGTEPTSGPVDSGRLYSGLYPRVFNYMEYGAQVHSDLKIIYRSIILVKSSAIFYKVKSLFVFSNKEGFQQKV